MIWYPTKLGVRAKGLKGIYSVVPFGDDKWRTYVDRTAIATTSSMGAGMQRAHEYDVRRESAAAYNVESRVAGDRRKRRPRR
jgi:hypothetical protein